MFVRIVPLVLFGYALGRWDAWCCERLLESERAASKAKPVEVTTWEGEGGALRGSGSQIGPAPVLP